MSHSVVPAYPGFTLLQYFANDGTEWVERILIVAWIVNTDGADAVPVLIDSAATGDKSLVGTGILLPDGRIIVPYSQHYLSEESWKEDMHANIKKPPSDETCS